MGSRLIVVILRSHVIVALLVRISLAGLAGLIWLIVLIVAIVDRVIVVLWGLLVGKDQNGQTPIQQSFPLHRPQLASVDEHGNDGDKQEKSANPSSDAKPSARSGFELTRPRAIDRRAAVKITIAVAFIEIVQVGAEGIAAVACVDGKAYTSDEQDGGKDRGDPQLFGCGLHFRILLQHSDNFNKIIFSTYLQYLHPSILSQYPPINASGAVDMNDQVLLYLGSSYSVFFHLTCDSYERWACLQFRSTPIVPHSYHRFSSTRRDRKVLLVLRAFLQALGDGQVEQLMHRSLALLYQSIPQPGWSVC